MSDVTINLRRRRRGRPHTSTLLIAAVPRVGDSIYLYRPDEIGPHGSDRCKVTAVAWTPGGEVDAIVDAVGNPD